MPLLLNMESNTAAVIGIAVWMIVWWISELVPMGITALIPVVAFPLLGISTTAATIANFANPTLYLFLGGFMLAIGMEKTGLHERIALYILRLFGKNTQGLIFGFFLATYLLSMWVSNTATALMMLPMARSVIVLLQGSFKTAENKNDQHYFALLLMLGIAYAANIGGVATLIGTPPNVVMKGYIESILNHSLEFGTWLILGIPLSFGMLVFTYFFLSRVMYRIRLKEIDGAAELIATKWQQLGRMSREEKQAAIIFGITAMLWIFAPALNSVLEHIKLDDSMIAIFGGSMMFVWPKDISFKRGILIWEDAHRLPWDILLLFGGGLALAHGMKESGLMESVGSLFSQFDYPSWILLALLTLVMLMLTEVMSNVALASIFIPLVIGIAQSANLDPIPFAVSVGLASSFAFMLPISTPPNAIVYGSGDIPMKEMIRSGFVLNLFSVLWIILMVKLLGEYAL